MWLNVADGNSLGLWLRIYIRQDFGILTSANRWEAVVVKEAVKHFHTLFIGLEDELKGTELEETLDDFVTFFIAGKYIALLTLYIF